MSALRRSALFAALSVLTACSGETSMMIEITSDFAVPDQLDGLRIEVVGSESGTMLDEAFELTESFPHDYRLYANSGSTSESVTITVSGTLGGAVIVRRVVAASFTSGAHTEVTVHLPSSCAGVTCPPGVDCEGGRCAGEDPDGGLDAGPRDAEVPDGGCLTDEHCDDGVACTTDTCDMGLCVSSPTDGLCADGEVCHPDTGCGAPCAGDGDCDDALFCNGAEVCVADRCVSGEPPDCDDAVACTTDSCDDTLAMCVNATDDAACDDLDPCNGAEVCAAGAGCEPGPPLDCDDMNDCTADACAATGCEYATRDVDMDGHGDALCPAVGGVSADDCDDSDGAIRPGVPDVCNGVDDDCDTSVDEGSTCAVGEVGACSTSCGSTGSRTCGGSCSWSVCVTPAEVCNGLDDDCNGTADDSFSCVQGERTPCTTSCGTTGSQLCDAACALGACEAPVEVCEDGVDQDCDGVDPLCLLCPGGTDAECDDGLPCNGVETCYRGSCAAGTPLSCDDGVRCTVDACDDAAGGCVAPPDDGFCADGNFCNGAETCDALLGCRLATAPSCDDTDGCTDDVCAGTSPGMCLSTTRDSDMDGHGDTACAPAGGVPADDCDDTSATVFTGAPELCNGIDDDCDTSCDDGFACCRGSTGSCTTTCGTTGSRVCSSVCSWGICSPPAEICNGVDDDCNGACDDAFACCQGSTGGCITSCGSMGSRSCSSGCDWGSCATPTETCTGVDDDCDGLVDEGFTCRAGASGSCTTACGSTGARVCTAACDWGSCAPPTEECNGVDDDCDGLTDEGFLCASGGTRSCLSSCGTTGEQSCSAGCTWGACLPPVEVCNGIDDDCNTFVDDGFTCASGDTGSCATSCGTTGSRTCDASCAWGTCSPPAEVCNGADDDCDTLCDDGFTCCRGSTQSCTTSCGSTGSQLCGASCGWGTCAPPTEICNGADDDCDGSVDDGFTCAAGSTGSCTTACGTTGSRTCDGACGWGSCSPPTEICNGTDDDCDGTVDEGFTCASGEAGACTTSCGTTGSRTCTGSCGWGACNPPPEACNGIDDDCDMTIDETLECTAGASGSCTTTCGSTGSRSCAASCTWESCTPPGEVCNGLDDDCDGLPDDGFTCAQGSSGSCVSSCGSTGSRTCGATCAWGSCAPPVEVCSGADDDCDGSTDEGFTCSIGAMGSCSTACGSTGTRVCDGTCGWGACSPPTETCNGSDDDCDTLIDEGFTCAAGASSSCLSSCGTTGSRTCSGACAWGACVPPSELCNGADDDCDGLPDDGFMCAQGSSGSCATSCGSTGSRICDASCAWGTCSPPTETCNGADDDCDGLPDETFVCVMGATGGCLTSCGSSGTRTCGGSCTWDACLPPTEVCNGADDDCDGFVDEIFTCATGSTDACTTSCGSTGTRTCDGTCSWGSCAPPTEMCNGADDDCDGSIDETFTCAPGASRTCSASCGTSGTQTCTAGCAWGPCDPPAETCNGVDDDCDTACDDGFACCQGSSGSCATSCGTTGSRTCSGSCAWGACAPPAEACNGIDDDCDTVCDDGFACCQGTIGACTTGCGTTGSRSCGATCTWGSCLPPAEICNGVDDDCDSTCDNGFSCCQGSTGACTTSCGSTGSRTCGGTCTWGSCSPPAEICNGADDDCDTVCDDGFTCCAGEIGACTSSCGTTGSRTCSAACGWGACAPPAEICDNGTDDNCDLATDCADPTCATHPSCAVGCGSCPGATVVSAPGGVYPVTLGADTYAGSCGGMGGSEAYLSLSITSASDVFISTHGAGIDTVIYVRACSCTGAEETCNDDADGYTTSMARMTDLPAGDYQIFIDTKAAMSASLDVHVYVSTPGTESDRCGNPTAILAGATSVTGSTCGFDADYSPNIVGGSPCALAATGAAEERVYYFVVPAAGTVGFDAGCGPPAYDMTAYVRSVCTSASSGDEMGCNDDGSCGGSPFCDSGKFNSALSTTLAPGLYFFFADGYMSSCGCGSYDYAVSGL